MSLSKSQFRSVIKSRESVKILTNPNVFKTEVGNTKNNFFRSAQDLEQVKNIGDFNSHNANYNEELENTSEKTKNKNIVNNNNYNNEKNTSENKNLKSGFGPAIESGSGNYKLSANDLENETKQINNIMNIKPEVFNYEQKLTAKEIERMVKDYKGKLNTEMLKILNEEKNKEEQREIKYNNTIDSVEKKRLEKMISFERNQSSEKILKINE